MAYIVCPNIFLLFYFIVFIFIIFLVVFIGYSWSLDISRDYRVYIVSFANEIFGEARSSAVG